MRLLRSYYERRPMREHTITTLRHLLEAKKEDTSDEELKKLEYDVNKACIGHLHARIRLSRVGQGYHMQTASQLPPELMMQFKPYMKKTHGLKVELENSDTVKSLVPAWKITAPGVLRKIRAANRGMLYRLTPSSKKGIEEPADTPKPE